MNTGTTHSAAHLSASQPLLHPTAVALPHVTGFPGLGVLRRLRPTHDHQSTVDVSRLRRQVAVDGWDDHGRFPCSLLFTRSRRSLTLPLRPRRAPIEYETEYYRQVNSRQQATPQTFSTASSSSGFTNPEKFPNPAGWGCATPGPDPPGSSRLALRGFTTPVPHVLLSIHAHRAHVIWQC